VYSPQRSRPQKTAEIVARRIVEDIRKGGFAIGDRLPHERLMLENYQIGRGTLREALRFLEFQGVISLKPGPGGGPMVERPVADNLATSLLLLLQFENAPFSTLVNSRVDLEPIMARLASEHISAEQLGLLAESVDRMEEGLSDKDIFLETNRDFHEIIAWASGNSLYGFLIDALIGIVDGSSLGVDYPDHRRSAILGSHRNILEALSNHDGDSSEESMKAHMLAYSRYLSKKYSSVLSEPTTWNMF